MMKFFAPLALLISSTALAGPFVELRDDKMRTIYVDPDQVQMIIKETGPYSVIYVSEKMIKIRVRNAERLIRSKK